MKSLPDVSDLKKSRLREKGKPMFGEYAEFIMPAYAITGITLIITVLVVWRTHVARLTELGDTLDEQDESEK